MVKGKHSKHDALDRYIVEFVPLDEITPSPENDDLYGPIRHDEQMECLIASIESIGLTDPIHLTQDDFILSGHRRFFALSSGEVFQGLVIQNFMPF